MSSKVPPRAVLDADIIFSRVLYEFMGRVAGRLRLLDLVWSQELLDEARRALMEKKQLTESVAVRVSSHFGIAGRQLGRGTADR